MRKVEQRTCLQRQEMQEMQVRIPGSEDPQRRKWQLTPVFLPRKFHRQRSLRGYSLQGQKELDTTEHVSQTRITLENKKFSKMYQKRIKTINIITRLQGKKSEGVIGTVRTNVQNDTGHPSISGQLQGFRK